MSTTKSKIQLFKNPIESFRDTTDEFAQTSNEFLKPLIQEFGDQLLGRKNKFSGELVLGESLEFKAVLSGKQKEIDSLKKQIVVEKRLFEEEKLLVEKKTGELRLQIEAIQVEVTKVAKATPQLAREVEIAALQAPVDSSEYQLFFFQHLFKFIKSFREHIENAHVWLTAVNTRARKKNVWGANFEKHGAKYLLSGEHYLQRSAA